MDDYFVSTGTPPPPLAPSTTPPAPNPFAPPSWPAPAPSWGYATPPPSTRKKVLVGLAVAGAILLVVSLLTALAIPVFLDQRAKGAAARHIPGASGYLRFGGSHGKLLAVGRPWGHACQPVVLFLAPELPDWVRPQAEAVVDEARADGINVTLQTRRVTWFPESVYFPPGLTKATVPFVGVFSRSGVPPRLSNGQPERLALGWNTELDGDDQYEHLTYAKGAMYTQVLAGRPLEVRRAVRQVIAMTQGIVRTSRADSGIALTATGDRFTPDDVAAMKVMSGCGDAAASTVRSPAPR